MDYNRIFIQDLGQRLARRLGMQTPNPAPTLAPEIMPILETEPYRQEHPYLGGMKVAAGTGTFTASAGDYTRFHLINPANSGMLVFVDYADVLSTSAGVWALALTVGTIAVAQSTVACDTRWGTSTTRQTAAAWGYQGTGTVPVTTGRVFTTTSGVVRSWDANLVLRPGSTLTWYSLGVNASSELNIRWRERPPAAPNELS